MKTGRPKKVAARPQKTVCIRRFDAKLFAAIKAQAQAEGIFVKDWLERAAVHELARKRDLLEARLDAANA